MKLLAGLLMVALAGCKTVTPIREFQSPPLTIVCVDPASMSQVLAACISYDPCAASCSAYIDIRHGVIYVPWSGNVDTHGNPLPDFESLGHELWHAVAGWWHGGTVYLPADK